MKSKVFLMGKGGNEVLSEINLQSSVTCMLPFNWTSRGRIQKIMFSQLTKLQHKTYSVTIQISNILYMHIRIHPLFTMSCVNICIKEFFFHYSCRWVLFNLMSHAECIQKVLNIVLLDVEITQFCCVLCNMFKHSNCICHTNYSPNWVNVVNLVLNLASLWCFNISLTFNIIHYCSLEFCHTAGFLLALRSNTLLLYPVANKDLDLFVQLCYSLVKRELCRKKSFRGRVWF